MTYSYVYMTELLIACLLGTQVRNQKTLKRFLFIVSSIFSITAFFIYAKQGVFFDSTRFDNFLNYARDKGGFNGPMASFTWTTQYSYYAKEPLVAAYLWLMSLLPFNGFLRLITMGFFFYFLTKIYLASKKNFEVSESSVVISFIVFLMMFNLFYEIEGIRNFLSFMIIAFFFYYDLVQKKHLRSILGYVVAVLVHPMSLAVIVIRYMVEIKNKIFRVGLFGVLLGYLYLMPLIISVLQRFSNITFINYIILKMQNYVYGFSDYEAHASVYEVFATSSILVVMIFTYFFALRKYVKQNEKKYELLVLYTIAFCIGSLLSVQLYLRTIMLILFLLQPWYVRLFSFSIKDNKKKDNLFYQLIVIVNFVEALFMISWWITWTYRFVDVIFKF